MHGRIERLRLAGRCLEGNPLGDPHERDVYVYVPPTSDSARLPVILLLPGYGSNHRQQTWTSRGRDRAVPL